jgi:SAM-dependent methyltransferase
MTFVHADGLLLPFSPGSFDFVLTFHVFSSIHESEAQAGLAKELMRMLAPEGRLLYWDSVPPSGLLQTFRRRAHASPADKSSTWIRAISKQQLCAAFAGCGVLAHWGGTGLMRAAGRLLLPVSRGACDAARQLPLLQSYALGVIRKSGATPEGVHP